MQLETAKRYENDVIKLNLAFKSTRIHLLFCHMLIITCIIFFDILMMEPSSLSLSLCMCVLACAFAHLITDHRYIICKIFLTINYSIFEAIDSLFFLGRRKRE